MTRLDTRNATALPFRVIPRTPICSVSLTAFGTELASSVIVRSAFFTEKILIFGSTPVKRRNVATLILWWVVGTSRGQLRGDRSHDGRAAEKQHFSWSLARCCRITAFRPQIGSGWFAARSREPGARCISDTEQKGKISFEIGRCAFGGTDQTPARFSALLIWLRVCHF